MTTIAVNQAIEFARLARRGECPRSMTPAEKELFKQIYNEVKLMPGEATLGLNIYCPTGKGGGKDNSCSSRSSGSEVVTIKNPDGGSPIEVRTHFNPSPAQAATLFKKYKGLRGLTNKKTHETVIWDPYSAVHVQIARSLGIEKISDYHRWELIEGAFKSKEVEAIFTKLTNPKWSKDEKTALGRLLWNAWCPTGPGGGRDNSCSPHNSRGSSSPVTVTLRALYGDTEVRTYRNPTFATAKKWMQRSKAEGHSGLRILRDTTNGDTYIWDASEAVHSDINRGLGIDQKLDKMGVTLFGYTDEQLKQSFDYIAKWNKEEGLTKNIFCPTGEGGGVDPTCTKADSTVPAEPGTTPVPEGHIRLYHYTGRNFERLPNESEDDYMQRIADTIRKEGLDIAKAKGSTYGEPDVVWASTDKPSAQKVYAEFSVHKDDPRWGLGRPDKDTDPREYEKRGWHVTFQGSIKPEEIIAVHEPWHGRARYLLSNPEAMKEAQAGKFDYLLDTPEYGKAVRHVKSLTKNAFCPTGPGGGQDNSCPPHRHDGDSYFSPQALAEARDQDSKSRTILVYLSPAEFLTLAESGYSADKEQTVQGVLAKGDKFNSIPLLSFEHNKSGDAWVVGHEGRHRARALQALGVTRIPVLLTSRGGDAPGIRWGEQEDASSYDRIKGTWPKTLRGEESGSIVFPVKDPLTTNAFCPTGPGGGKDNSCPPTRQGSGVEEVPLYSYDVHTNRWSALDETFRVYRNPSMTIIQAWLEKYRALRVMFVMETGDLYIADAMNSAHQQMAESLHTATGMGYTAVWHDKTPVDTIKKYIDYWKKEYHRRSVKNVYCPNGPGGGKDPTCTKDGVSLHSTGTERVTLENGTEVLTHRNITKARLTALLSRVQDSLRGVVTPAGDLYVWDADKAVHYPMVRALGFDNMATHEFVLYKPDEFPSWELRLPDGPTKSGDSISTLWTRIRKAQKEQREVTTNVATSGKYSSTQVMLPLLVAHEVIKMGRLIDKDDLAEDGREDEPHITVKYGLTIDSPNDQRLHDVLDTWGRIKAKLGKTSIFEVKDKYDVVKIDVTSDDLKALNAAIRDAVPHEDTYPVYVPHVTLAYVKPGLGKKYVGMDQLDGTEVEFDYVVFSSKDQTYTMILIAPHSMQTGTRNAFCPTGEGGGIDNSCSPVKGATDRELGTSFMEILKKHFGEQAPTEEKPYPYTRSSASLVWQGRSIGIDRHGDTVDIRFSQPDKPGPAFEYVGDTLQEGSIAFVHKLKDVVVDLASHGFSITEHGTGDRRHKLYEKELKRLGLKKTPNGVWVKNVFCATGPGGGKDPTCKKDDAGSGGAWESKVHSSGNVEDDLENAETTNHVQAILDHYGFERLDASGIVADFISRDLYQNADGDLVEWDGKNNYTSYTSASDVHQWIDAQDVSGIEGYFEEQFNKDFWSQRPGNLYHATPSENIESVKQHGIQVNDRTRGMSNRNTGPAVYTTAEFGDTEAGIYGDAVFEIDAAAMRADKNTPYVALEPDVAEGEARSALASALNVDDYEYEYESGMSPNTVVVFGSIPAKYVKLVE